MIRHDFECPECGRDDLDRIIDAKDVDNTLCRCGARMVIAFHARARNAQWSDRDVSVIYRDAQGNIRYPMRNDEPTPTGCERVEIRSMSAMRRFEREQGVTSEVSHWDTNWRGLESQPGYDGRPVGPMKGLRG